MPNYVRTPYGTLTDPKIVTQTIGGKPVEGYIASYDPWGEGREDIWVAKGAIDEWNRINAQGGDSPPDFLQFQSDWLRSQTNPYTTNYQTGTMTPDADPYTPADYGADGGATDLYNARTWNQINPVEIDGRRYPVSGSFDVRNTAPTDLNAYKAGDPNYEKHRQQLAQYGIDIDAAIKRNYTDPVTGQTYPMLMEEQAGNILGQLNSGDEFVDMLAAMVPMVAFSVITGGAPFSDLLGTGGAGAGGTETIFGTGDTGIVGSSISDGASLIQSGASVPVTNLTTPGPVPGTTTIPEGVLTGGGTTLVSNPSIVPNPGTIPGVGPNSVGPPLNTGPGTGLPTTPTGTPTSGSPDGAPPPGGPGSGGPGDLPPTTPDGGGGDKWWKTLWKDIFGTDAPDTLDNIGFDDWLRLIGGVGGAIINYNNEQDYSEQIDKLIERMDPFYNQRPYYQDLLKQSFEDPNFLANSASFQNYYRPHQKGLESKLAGMGRSQSGNALSELQTLGVDTAAQYLQGWQQNVGNFAGAQIQPSSIGTVGANAAANSYNMRNQTYGDIGNAISSLPKIFGIT